jgi:DHA1 family multidrug resistance protein-like MFS transporter
MANSLVEAASKERSRPLRALWQSIYWVSFPFGILGFVLPIYGKEMGASALEVGAFFSAFSIIPVIVRPFLGRALDRWGRRPFLLLGLAGYVGAMVMFCFANTVTLLTIARFIQGIGSAFLWISAYTMVADIAEATGRGHNFGIIDEAANRGGLIGTTVGFLVIFFLANAGYDLQRTWLLLFAAYTLPAIISFWIGWRGIVETRPASAISPIQSHPFSKQLLALMMIVFITGASGAMVWPLLMIFLQDILSADINALAIAYIPAALIGSFLPSRMGRIADHLGRKIPMMLGLIVGALASFIIPHLRSIMALSALWTVETLGYVTSLPAERAFVADIAGEDVRGTNYGLYTFAFFLGGVVGPLAGGWLYDTIGHASPFYLNSLFLLFGSLLVAVLLRDQSRSKRPA